MTQLLAGKIKAAQNFPRDILRGILSPMFGGVKRNDANRVAVLAGHQVVDGGSRSDSPRSVFANAVPCFPKLLTTR
jgi:hypothetical protein